MSIVLQSYFFLFDKKIANVYFNSQILLTRDSEDTDRKKQLDFLEQDRRFWTLRWKN